MARISTQLADALSAARHEKAGDYRARYERAVKDCDAAWDGIEGALMSGLYVLAVEAHAEFRAAYGRKLSLHRQMLEAHAVSQALKDWAEMDRC